ncbi:Transmembrane protein 135 N-terminal domain-containing protein [Plasmodiophora brassicae]
MEVNALTRWESLNAGLSELTDRRRVKRHRDSSAHLQNELFPKKFELPAGGPLFFPDDVDIPLAPEGDGASGPGRSTNLLLLLAQRAVRRFGKGFAVGALLQALFTTSKMVLKRKPSQTKKRTTPMEALGLNDIFGFGCFVGSFLTIFEIGMLLIESRCVRTLDEVGEDARSHEPGPPGGADDDIGTLVVVPRSRTWSNNYNPGVPMTSISTAVVGACAGTSLLFAPKSYRVPLAVFFGVRALEVSVRLLNRRGLLPHVPHSDVLLMALASGQVLYAYVFDPSLLDKGYLGFLNYQGGKARVVVDSYSNCMMGKEIPGGQLAKLNLHRQRIGLAPVSPGHDGCEILHPGTSSCFGATVSFFLESMRRALPVYVPVYFLPLLMFKTRRILSQPWQQSWHTVLGILRSSSFLASYCSVAWLVSCWARTIGLKSPISGYLSGLAAGSTVAIEKGPRRIELALYVLSRALYTFGHYIERACTARQVRVHVPHLEVASFMITCAIICHSFVWDPSSLRSGYYNLLKWMIGSGTAYIERGEPPCKRND